MYREETIHPGHAPLFHPMHTVGGNFPRILPTPLSYAQRVGNLPERSPHHPMYKEEVICLRDCQVPMLCTGKGAPCLVREANHHLPSSRCGQLLSDTHSSSPRESDLSSPAGDDNCPASHASHFFKAGSALQSTLKLRVIPVWPATPRG